MRALYQQDYQGFTIKHCHENRFLREVCLPEHNARFAVPAEEPAAAFVEVPEALWRDVLCVQEERRVGNDHGVRWHGRSRSRRPRCAPTWCARPSRVHASPDGTLALFKGPQRLASFPPAAPARAEDLAA